MEEISELYVKKVFDRGFVKYFIHLKVGNRIIGKVVSW